MQRIERLFGRGERARRTARQHPVGLVRSLGRRLFQLALVIVAARLIGSQTVADWLSLEFLATLPIAATAQAIPGWIGTLLFWVGAILVGLALFDGVRWYQTRFILTDQRLLQQRGVIGLLVVDTPLDRIDEIVRARGETPGAPRSGVTSQRTAPPGRTGLRERLTIASVSRSPCPRNGEVGAQRASIGRESRRAS